MASLSPTITKNNLVSSAQERFSVNVSNVPKNNIIAAYKNITRDRLPLPPLALSEDKTLMIDVKSPLTGKNYKTLFSSTSTKSQLRRIAKKVDLMNYLEMTKDELVRQITEYLSTLDICEPVELQRKRKTTKNVVSNTNNFESLNNETPSLNNNNNFKTVNNNFGNNGNRTNVSLGNGNNGNRTNVSLGNGNNGNRTNVSLGNGNRTNVSLGNGNRTTVSRNGFTRGPAPKGRNQPKSMRNKNLNGGTSINSIKIPNININVNADKGFFSKLFSGGTRGRATSTNKNTNTTSTNKKNKSRGTGKAPKTAPVDTNAAVNVKNTDDTKETLRKVYGLKNEEALEKISKFYDERYSKTGILRKEIPVTNQSINIDMTKLHSTNIDVILLVGKMKHRLKAFKTFKARKIFNLMHKLFYEPFILAIMKKYNVDTDEAVKIYKRYLIHLETSQVNINIYQNLPNFVRKVRLNRANKPVNTQTNKPVNKNVNAKNKIINRINPDGSCLFRSIVRGDALLNGLKMTKAMEDKKTQELRVKIVEMLCGSNKNRYRKEVSEAHRGNEKLYNAYTYKKNDGTNKNYKFEDWDRYCAEMKKPGIWGGLVEIYFAPRIIKRPIEVYHEVNGVRKFYKKYTDQINNNNLRKEPVTILYKGNHYDLLTTKPANKQNNKQKTSGGVFNIKKYAANAGLTPSQISIYFNKNKIEGQSINVLKLAVEKVRSGSQTPIGNAIKELYNGVTVENIPDPQAGGRFRKNNTEK